MKNSIIAFKYLLVLCLLGITLTASAQGDPTDSIPGDPGGLSVYSMQDIVQYLRHGSAGGSVSMSTASYTGAAAAVLRNWISVWTIMKRYLKLPRHWALLYPLRMARMPP